VFVAVAVVAAGFGYGYVRYRLGQIHRIRIPGLTADDSAKPMNVLLVGSDSRARLSGKDAAQAGKGQVQGERSDTIMVLHIDPHQQKAAILSIPRDLYVPIAGTNRSDRVNVAYSLGGPKQLISTISSNLHIQINHYVEVDFVGFKDIVSAVGGVSLYLPAPTRDLYSGLAIPKAGCVSLNGGDALAWVRSRHYQYFESGRWRDDPRSDLGRIQRQQDFIRRMMKKAVSTGLTNPIQLNRLIGIGVKDVSIDSSLSTTDIVRLAKRFRSLNPDSVEPLTLPTTPVKINGADVLRVKQPDAQGFIDRINGLAPDAAVGGKGATVESVRPSAVRVRVLNGNGADGSASTAASALQEPGFLVADKGDADSFHYAHSVIRYAPGALAKAQLLERYLSAGAQLKADSTLRTADVALVVGVDYTGVRSQPLPPANDKTATTTGTTLPQLTPVPAPRGAAAQPSC